MCRRAIAVWGLLLLASFPASAESSRDEIHLGQDIHVPDQQSVKDAVCLLCSVHIDGEALGDVVVFAGNVSLKGTVDRDVVDLGGRVTLASTANIHGSLVIFGGRLSRDSAATVGHEIVVVPPIVFLPIILFLVAIVGGLVLLLRYLLFRGREAAYPSFPRA